MSRTRRQAGYTLMEVLVMLAITSLIATVVFDAVRSAAAFGVRVESASRAAAGEYVDFATFRRAVRAIQPDYRNAAGAFQGDEDGFTALSAETPGAAPGDRRVITVSLEEAENGDLVLALEAGGAARPPEALEPEDRVRTEIRRWPEATGVFDYLPASPSLADPAAYALGLSTSGSPPDWRADYPGDHGFAAPYFIPSPGAVRLTVEGAQGREVHIFHPAATKGPPARIDDLFGSAETP